MEMTIEHLYKKFDKNQVLDDVSLHVISGKPLGLLGRNGAGKTTLIRTIMKIYKLEKGSIQIDGVRLKSTPVRFGYLPEERGLYLKRNILDQMIYLGMLKGLARGLAKSAAESWLQKLEMTPYKNRRLDTLSKGNQQKIQLAVALLDDPEVIILDEPFSGLDPVNATMLKDIVKEQAAKNKVILFSSHQMNYVEEFCDHIAILNGGKIVLSGDIREIKKAYDRSKIKIASSDAERIVNFVTQQLTEIVKEIKQNGEECTITLHHPAQKNELYGRLITENFNIDMLKVLEPSLDNIFVEYTEGRQ